MKKTRHLFLLVLSFLFIHSSHAQYITVTDPSMLTVLQWEGFGSCLSGNQLDTICVQNTIAAGDTILNLTYGGSYPIANIDAIQYFKGLRQLYLNNNYGLTSLPILPYDLRVLRTSNTAIGNVSYLPPRLRLWESTSSQITNISFFPDSLQKIQIASNPGLDSLPSLPPLLNYIDCNADSLGALPNIPPGTKEIYALNNQLTSLPVLPNSLLIMNVSYNSLTNLPELPPNMQSLDCDFNDILCLPYLPTTLTFFNFAGNNIPCFPNQIPNCYNPVDVTNYPLCSPGNINGCQYYSNIQGKIFNDTDANCMVDSLELIVGDIRVDLYADTILTGIAYSFSDGYGFFTGIDTFDLRLDTLNKPYQLSCLSNSIDTNIVVTNPDSVQYVNWGIECKAGYDVGAWSIVTSGSPFFPGEITELKIKAGDFSDVFGNLSCASGIAGDIIVQVNGPVTYISPGAGSISPSSVAGNTFTYTIADFGQVDFENDFELLFATDTTAFAGDSVCVDINVNPLVGDINPVNNNLNICFAVVNSFDPNIKEVSPIGDVIYPFTDWLTYTIHFQNTGNAPAINIKLQDVLDSDLDISTFELLSHSHNVKTTINSSNLTFRFNNINLSDSASDPEGSIGYVQYRIKPKGLKAIGTLFNNTANIYFDYNPPITTNTTTTEIVSLSAAGVNAMNPMEPVLVYPIPCADYLKIQAPDKIQIDYFKIMDITGKTIDMQLLNTHFLNYSIAGLPNGIYLIELVSGKNRVVKKVIISH